MSSLNCETFRNAKCSSRVCSLAVNMNFTCWLLPLFDAQNLRTRLEFLIVIFDQCVFSKCDNGRNLFVLGMSSTQWPWINTDHSSLEVNKNQGWTGRKVQTWILIFLFFSPLSLFCAVHHTSGHSVHWLHCVGVDSVCGERPDVPTGQT